MKDYRILKEWVDASGNKAAAYNIPAKLPETGYKEKFQKLLDYHKQYVGNDVLSTEIKKLNNYGFEYWETRLAVGSTSETITIVEVDIHDDGEYYAYVWQDGQCIDLSHDDDFDTLLGMLSKHLNIPAVNSSEYKKLLEWVDANGNKASTSKPTNDLFKDRFMKLAKHIEDCYDWSIVNYVSEWELDLEYANSGTETLTLEIDVNSKNIKVYLKRTASGQPIAVFETEHAEWAKVLDFLKDLRVIKYPKLCEWIDAKGNKAPANNQASQQTINNKSAEVVYIWDMYIDPRDKGTWCSAEKYHGEYDGCVFKTKNSAINAGLDHLLELEDEGQLRGDPSDYDVEAIAIPLSEVSVYTLEFSGLK